MSEKNTFEQYGDYLNDHILPFIDYEKLQASYKTDMVYAKGILNLLHEAMVDIYGGEYLDWSSGDDGYVLIPGVLRSSIEGNICLALLTLDLQSSGEHSGTHYLCKFGAVSQVSEEGSELETQVMNSFHVPYEYCYTAVISDDHHVDYDELPKELKAVLNDFHKYKAELTRPPEVPGGSDKKPSLLEGVRETEKEIKEQNKDKSKNIKSKPEL